jgi:hypothetical protein
MRSMQISYGFCDGNSLAAPREYQRRYPDRREPYRHVFETVHRNLTETGTAMAHARVCRGKRNVQVEGDVLDIVHNNPSISTRHFEHVIMYSTFNVLTSLHPTNRKVLKKEVL